MWGMGETHGHASLPYPIQSQTRGNDPNHPQRQPVNPDDNPPNPNPKPGERPNPAATARAIHPIYSTVTDLAKLRG
jgi:hypothetical protein